jgi:hypothetical protein
VFAFGVTFVPATLIDDPIRSLVAEAGTVVTEAADCIEWVMSAKLAVGNASKIKGRNFFIFWV